MLNKVRKIQYHIKEILLICGIDLTDENFRETPERVAKILAEDLTIPKKEDLEKLFITFPEEHDQLIVLKNHKVLTRCPHHLERVEFKVSLGYIPKGRVLGVSKLARLADFLAKGCVLQETYTDKLVDTLMQLLHPVGAACLVEGVHGCMKHRGVKTEGSIVTHAFRGDIKFEEFLSIIKA